MCIHDITTIMARLSKDQILTIIHLRETGHSLPEIRRITKHSNGTIFKYIQGVRIKPEFIEYWKSRRKPSIFRKAQAIKKAEEKADRILKNITAKGKILVGLALYWGEGARGECAIINSDPDLLKVFIECLSELGVTRNSLSMSIRIYEDIDPEEARKFWINITGLPRNQITSTNILNGKKTGKLTYGMCRIRVIKGGDTLKLLNALKQKLIKLLN